MDVKDPRDFKEQVRQQKVVRHNFDNIQAVLKF